MPVIRNLRELNRAKKAKVLEPDMYFVPKGELVLELRDSTDSLIFEKREKLTISSVSTWEKLMSNLEIKEDGNLKVYIDNSSSDKVYFDEFIIERTEATVAVVVQENHYYPFGMNMKGIEELDLQSLDSKDEHRFQYNGKEKEKSFGLHWTDYGWRNMDTQLGRWHGVDKLAEKYAPISSYTYVANNPLKFIDPDGMRIGHDVNSQTGEAIYDGKEDGIIRLDGKQILERDTNGNTILSEGATGEDVVNYIRSQITALGQDADTNWQGGITFEEGSGQTASLGANVVATYNNKDGYKIVPKARKLHNLEIKGLLTALQNPSEIRSELRHEDIHRQVAVYMQDNEISLVFQSEAHYNAYSETGAVLMGNFANNMNTANTEQWSSRFRNGRVNYLQRNNVLPYIRPNGSHQWDWATIGEAMKYWQKQKSTTPFFILLGAKQQKGY